MALTVILICILAISALNLLLVCDLYGRSSYLARLANDQHRTNMGLKFMLEQLAADNPGK